MVEESLLSARCQVRCPRRGPEKLKMGCIQRYTLICRPKTQKQRAEAKHRCSEARDT
uniref:Uncharacterized protein n=1 Tax=Solanum tuberosum TaxID=4113 RepID=M1ASS1_SOLTU